MSGGAALVLSGGGSRGAYQAGCWKALHETGFRPSLIVGTSVGALNGAMIVQGMGPEEMEKWWLRLRTRDLFRLRKDAWRVKGWLGFHRAAGLRALLAANLDFEKIRNSETEFLVTATDLATASEVVYANQDLALDHFMATTALLPGLSPVQIGGNLIADGGHWNAFPLGHALERGHTRVVGLLHDPLASHAEPAPTGLPHLLRRLSDVAWHSQQQVSLALLYARTRLPIGEPDRLAQFDLAVHAPEPPLATMLLRFDPRSAKSLYDSGYAQTRRRLG